jgi:alpha-L-fucosidase
VDGRVKGSLLLNIGPSPKASCPSEQEEPLREIALWMQVSQDCIYSVRPTREVRSWTID